MILKNGKRIDGSSLTSVTVVDDLLGGISTEALSANQGKILNESKVDKVDGKALSTNDFTNDYKKQVDDNTTNRHNHGNSDLLNSLTDAKVAEWDAKSTFSGNYNDLTNKPTIPTVPTNISAFTNDRGYITGYTETDPTVPSHVKAITTANIEDWNNKSEFSGSYNDLTNKPTIPTTTSALTNDSGFLTEVPSGYVMETDLAKVATTGNYHDLSNTPDYLSDLVDDIGLVTAADLAKVASTGSYNDLLDLPDLTAITAGMKADQLWNNTDNPAYVAPVEETGEFQGYNVYQLETGMYIVPDNTMLYYGTSAKSDGAYTQLYEGIAEGLLIVANDPDGENCHVVSSVLIDTASITYNYSFYDTDTSIFAMMQTYNFADFATKTDTVKMSEFYVCNVNMGTTASAFETYQFEEGMTWEDWMASEYNTTEGEMHVSEDDDCVYTTTFDYRTLTQGNVSVVNRTVLKHEKIGPGCWYYTSTRYQ